MDACHLFPSRLWLFDKHMIHGGRASTYAFKYMGRNLTLTALPPPKLLKSKLGQASAKSLFLSEIWVKRAINKSKPLFTLLVVESNTSKGVKPMHPLAQSLLKEFEDVFSNDLPSGLPTLRGIKDQIGLLLGTPLSNKLAYRYNPNELKEL